MLIEVREVIKLSEEEDETIIDFLQYYVRRYCQGK